MKDITISDDIIYIGADDKEIGMFESQYIVPNGISYNSYIILDEKIAIMDTIDKRKTNEWMTNIEKALNGKTPDYLVVSHLEPDHSYNIPTIVKKYPNIKIVGNKQTFTFISQFYSDTELQDRTIEVKEGDTLDLGKHKLKFIMAPMVHWPEVMMEYEETEKILFSADGFGKFGALDCDEGWDCEARRYYFNIVGKYGAQVQAVLRKASALDIKMICPLHGPILKEDLAHYINKYDIWSSYKPETEGIYIACCSIHGNTMNAAKELKQIIEENSSKRVVLSDLAREDFAECIEDAFRYDTLVCMAPTYDMGVFTPMEQFLNNLVSKNYQNRRIALVENGTWAPVSGKVMKEIISKMKNIDIVDPVVTIKSVLNEDSKKALKELANKLI